MDDSVTVVVGGKEMNFGKLGTCIHDGVRTADAPVGRAVFGAPTTSYDVGRKTQLHETSRRHSEHCGIDAVVAGLGLAAEQTALTFVEFAKKPFPGGTYGTGPRLETTRAARGR